jgi:hypothetical protein
LHRTTPIPLVVAVVAPSVVRRRGTVVLDSDAVEAVLPCRHCGRRFIYSRSFYEERALTPPHLCRRCRENRKRRLVELVGVVKDLAGDRALIQADKDGAVYRCRREPAFSRGARVVFAIDPAEAPQPRARNVKLVA